MDEADKEMVRVGQNMLVAICAAILMAAPSLATSAYVKKAREIVEEAQKP